MLRIDPRVVAWDYLDMGCKLMLQARHKEAVAAFRQALSLDPEDARAHFNLGLCLLSLGDYAQGWLELEWRWKIFDWKWGYLDESVHRLKAIKEWRGQVLLGHNLLVYHEQGYGDNIMMLRYLPLFLRGGANVTVWTLEPLRPLIEHFFPEVNCITKLPDDLSQFHFRTATYGVMSALIQTPDKVPSAPFLKMEMKPLPGRLGVTWSGVTQRVYKAQEFIRLLDHRNYELQALQLGLVPYGVKACQTQDFLGLAFLMSRMEHIVTVDTATVHLAGAIGHPSVHLILPKLPDWRWYRADVWYPNIHIYKEDNWSDINRFLNP